MCCGCTQRAETALRARPRPYRCTLNRIAFPLVALFLLLAGSSRADCLYASLSYPEKTVLVFPGDKTPPHVCTNAKWEHPELPVPADGCKQAGKIYNAGVIAKMPGVGIYKRCVNSSKGFDWQEVTFALVPKAE